MEFQLSYFTSWKMMLWKCCTQYASKCGKFSSGRRTEKVIARTWKQPRCPSEDEWIRKLWYIYTMEYYSATKKNTFESILMRWLKLEPIIQSEVSQKEKHQYSILTHIYMEFRKMVTITLYAAAKSLHSCSTLCDPIDGSPPGSPVPGILQARTLEWVAISFSRGSAQPRDGTLVSCLGRWILYHWATWKVQMIRLLRL